MRMISLREITDDFKIVDESKVTDRLLDIYSKTDITPIPDHAEWNTPNYLKVHMSWNGIFIDLPEGTDVDLIFFKEVIHRLNMKGNLHYFAFILRNTEQQNLFQEVASKDKIEIKIVVDNKATFVKPL